MSTWERREDSVGILGLPPVYDTYSHRLVDWCTGRLTGFVRCNDEALLD